MPLILSSNPDSESLNSNSMKSFTAEPEMEDCNDTGPLKNLIKELGIEESLSNEIELLKHDSASPGNCVHCRMLQKLNGLQSEITKLNEEICTTHEIINLKRDQNGELISMIDRIEGSMARGSEHKLIIDQSSSTCSCGNKCNAF